jgi:hypothetical protein
MTDQTRKDIAVLRSALKTYSVLLATELTLLRDRPELLRVHQQIEQANVKLQGAIQQIDVEMRGVR